MIYAAVSLAVLAGCFLVDEPVYQWVHHHWNYYTRPVPDLLKLPTRLMRSMEDWGENVYIVCVLYAMWVFDRKRRSRVLMLIASALLVTLAVEGVKRVTSRERPEFNGGRTTFHGWVHWGSGGDYESFPSGHSASAASYSGSLSAFYPPLRPVAVALAVGCGGNRIWKERHFLSDCWAGGSLGFGVAFALARWSVTRRWMERVDRRLAGGPGAIPKAFPGVDAQRAA
jgi:membrane-associated phospholipid phosphatase